MERSASYLREREASGVRKGFCRADKNVYPTEHAMAFFCGECPVKHCGDLHSFALLDSHSPLLDAIGVALHGLPG